MISLKDASVLALAKLRTRRIRTIVTIIVSGVLFGALIAALIVVASGFKSADKFNEAVLGGQYIVQADYMDSDTSLLSDTSLQARATAIYNQDIADKRAAAKRLGIDFDSTSVAKPLMQAYNSDGMELDLTSLAAQQALSEYRNVHPVVGLSDLQQLARQYHPTAFYQTHVLTPNDGSVKIMNNGKESFSPIGDADDFLTKTPPRVINTAVVSSFLLSNSLVQTKSDAIPIILPYSIAEAQLGLVKLSSKATPQQKLDRLKELQVEAPTITFDACYRNSVSQTQITQAIQATIKSNPTNESVIYGLPPADTCAAATVVSDSRSLAQKKQDQNQQVFDEEFNVPVIPVQQKVQFHIVGLMPDNRQGEMTASLTQIVQSFLGPTLLGNPTIPQEMYQNLSNNKEYGRIFTTSPSSVEGAPVSQYLVKFANAADAAHFIADKSCDISQGLCRDTTKPFVLKQFGSNSIGLLNTQNTISRVLTPVIVTIVIIAIITMAGTFGRVIVDERHETAIFRALGATRLDITTIYMVYALMLSLLVAIFALLLGLCAAYIFDMSFWQQATIEMQLTYDIVNQSLQMRFFTFDAPMIWPIAIIALGTGLFSVLLPLQHNIGRSIIQDIKDE